MRHNREHLHNLSTYSLHSMITVSTGAWVFVAVTVLVKLLTLGLWHGALRVWVTEDCTRISLHCTSLSLHMLILLQGCASHWIWPKTIKWPRKAWFSDTMLWRRPWSTWFEIFSVLDLGYVYISRPVSDLWLALFLFSFVPHKHCDLEIPIYWVSPLWEFIFVWSSCRLHEGWVIRRYDVKQLHIPWVMCKLLSFNGSSTNVVKMLCALLLKDIDPSMLLANIWKVQVASCGATSTLWVMMNIWFPIPVLQHTTIARTFGA